MSVVGIAEELPDSPKAEFELNALKVTRTFLVQTDDFADGPMVAVSAVGIPRPLEFYAIVNESAPYVRCRSLDAERKEPNSLYWLITAHYSTPEPKEHREKSGSGTDTDGAYQNPLLELPEIDMSFETVEIPITESIKNIKLVDQGGNTVTGGTNTGNTETCQSSAGEVFVPPPNRSKSHVIITIARNETISFAATATAVQYIDTVNSDNVFGCSAGQVKMKSITAKREVKQLSGGTQIPYLRVTYILHVRDSWDIQLLDKGSYYKDSSGGMLNNKPFLDSAGNPVEGLLDGTGHALLNPPVGGVTQKSGVNQVYTVYRPYTRQAFAPLNLPNTWLDVQ